MTEQVGSNIVNDRKRKLAFALLIVESSSDDGSSDDDLLQLLIKEKVLRPKNAKKWSLLDSYSEQQLMSEFRMDRQICLKLIEDFQKSSFYPKNDSRGGTPKSSAENHILSFLRFAGSKTCIRDVAIQFSIGESTFHRQMARVMNYLVDIAPRVIKFPETEDEKATITHQFEEISGFPGVLGSVDSTYIPIRTPANRNKSDYVNHQLQISLTLQGICNPDGTFLDVFTGPPSRIHDAKVFRLSFIRGRLSSLCNNGQLHLVGDEAFPLSDYLMTPYKEPDGLLSQAQANYNAGLYAAHQPIRRAFRLLKQRFRQLSRLDFHQLDTAAKFTLSCCVLHNLCVNSAFEGFEDDTDAEDSLLYDDPPQDDDASSAEEIRNRQSGETKRNQICSDLWTKVGTTLLHH